MARAFISYRRADGQYAVGWIEERLAGLDEVSAVRTAFRDSALRHGDSLTDALTTEVEQCDLLIAVIGPNWHGRRPDGPPRILDPDDWVGREITIALANGTRIIPVLIGGAERLHAEDLLPRHQPLADLLALHFDDLSGLDELEATVRAHLGALDLERATIGGLADEIIVPPLERPWWLWPGAFLAGLVGGWLGWHLLPIGQGDVNGQADVLLQRDAIPQGAENRTWRWGATIAAGYWVTCCFVGIYVFHQRLRAVIDVRWRTVLRTGVLALVMVALTVSSVAPGGDAQIPVTIVQATAAVLLLSPWIVMLIGANWSTSRAVALRDRALVIAIHRRSLTLATPVIVFALGLSSMTTATVIIDRDSSFRAGFALIAFGVFLSLIVVGALVYSSARLVHDSDLLRIDVRALELDPAYSSHVEAVLVKRQLGARSPLIWMASFPTIVAATAVVIGAAL